MGELVIEGFFLLGRGALVRLHFLVQRRELGLQSVASALSLRVADIHHRDLRF